MHNGSKPHIPDFDVEGAPVCMCLCESVCVCLGGPTEVGNSVWPSPEQKEMKESSKRVMNRGEKSRRVLQSLDSGKK